MVPRLYEGEHPYILQNDDKRIVFVIPFERDFSLIGTTDVPYEGDPGDVRDHAGRDRLSVPRRQPLLPAPRSRPADVVWSYAGVRPLYDDASGNASAVTRDYVFDLDAGAGRAPLLSIFGGKITTYRKLAEHALGQAAAGHGLHATARGPRTRPCPAATSRTPTSTLPRRLRGARIPGCRRRCCSAGRAPTAPGSTRSSTGASRLDDLGRDLGGGLYEAEVDYLVAHEWARTADDVLWRRSRLGLHVGDGHGGALDAPGSKRGAPARRRRSAMSLRLDGIRRVVRRRGLDRRP